MNDGVDPELLSLFPSGVNTTVTGALAIQGITLSELATRFGTPAYIIDEDDLRQAARSYQQKLRRRRQGSGVAFASKAFPCAAVYRVMGEEGLQVDVAGGGELFLALKAGVAPKQIVLHGNAKTDAELQMAVDNGVGSIVLDGWDDIRRLENIRGRHQVLLRVNPSVQVRTMAAISTGHHGSKFGMPIHEAAEAITHVRASRNFELRGLHAHIGSQILELDSFAEAIDAVASLGDFDVYDVGGGLGVKYRRGDAAPSVDDYLDVVTEAAKKHLPTDAEVWIEPGRSLVARSTFTLYRVVTVKHGAPTFVAVDGGIADNFEASTYVGTRFDAVIADRPMGGREVELVGRHCESGDLFGSDILLNEARPGDVVAMPMTGAYTYTLANNYNGALRPPVVLVTAGVAREVVRRETLDDLVARDVLTT